MTIRTATRRAAVAIRTPALLAIAIALAASVLSGTVAAPVANADKLSNGLEVNCNLENEHNLVCVISGCARVHGDYVIDAVHIMTFNAQEEHEFKCINGQTTRYTTDPMFGTDGTRVVSVQGCRKKDLEGDWCGPWADYTFTRPAGAAPQAPAPQAPAAPAAPAAKPDIQCPAGSPTPTVPAGQTCAPIPDVTNAIQASFGDPGLTSLDFNVTNTSSIEAACTYTATANSLNPLVPKKTTRQFNVPANGNHTETFSGAITGTTYNAVLSCKDASGKQKAELGHVTTSVTW
jgi:hypothetical protein